MSRGKYFFSLLDLLYDCHVTLSHFVEKNFGLKHTFKTVYVTADVAELS